MTSVFPPPKRAQVKLRSTSVSTCVDTEASLEILEMHELRPPGARSDMRFPIEIDLICLARTMPEVAPSI
jgi:hypothetical protein